MVKVESRDTLNLVTSRFMKSNKKRNLLAILSIILTTLLFTSLFMGTGSLLLSNQATLMKQTLCSSHTIAQNMTDDEAYKAEEFLKKDTSVKKYGKGIFLGAVIDKRLPYSTELRSGDEAFLESFNCKIKIGRLPRKENEIAVSSLVLNALGIPEKVGEKITLTWEKDEITKELVTDTFTVVGFWKGDKAVLAQFAFTSASYAENNRYRQLEGKTEQTFNGSTDIAVWYKRLYGLNEKTKEINNSIQFQDTTHEFVVSPAFEFGGEDSFSFFPLIVFIIGIILAGYLIIYNIFSLSVQMDIKTYGLLKNVGMTGKQLKKVVRMQVFRLCAVGIPLGLLAGYFAGKMMAPSLTAEIAVSSSSFDTTQTVVAANPIIFIFSAVMAFFTVYISSLKACRIVDKVSPVEALKVGQTACTHKKNKKTKTVSWGRMAFINMKYNIKKGIIVMLSLALSLVTINVIYMLVTGYDFEEYQKIFISSDFQVDKMTGTLGTSDFNGVTKKVKILMDHCEDVEDTGYVYYSDEKHKMTPHMKEVMKEFEEKYGKNWGEQERKLYQEIKDKNEMTVHYLGITESIFDRLKWPEGMKPCTWEEFNTGENILIDYPDKYDRTHTTSYYFPEDSFKMDYQNGKSKSYNVLGEALMPYALDYPFSDIFFLTVLVPEKEYIRITRNESAMYGIMDAKSGKREEVNEYIQKNIVKKDALLNVSSVLSIQESFKRYLNKYYTIGAFLVVVLIFIGIMNFYNTIATNMISRKNELTLLEIVGMTRSDVMKMLSIEGILYISGAFLIAATIIYFGAEALITNTLGMAFFYHAETTLMPCILMIPVLLFIAIIIPVGQYKKMEKESLVERLRVEL